MSKFKTLYLGFLILFKTKLESKIDKIMNELNSIEKK